MVYIPCTCVLYSLHVHVYNTTSMYYISTRYYNNIHVHVHECSTNIMCFLTTIYIETWSVIIPYKEYTL